jgi:hypothetical protein
MEKKMDKEYYILLIKVCIKVNFWIMKSLDKENIFGQMEKFIEVNGKIIK